MVTSAGKSMLFFGFTAFGWKHIIPWGNKKFVYVEFHWGKGGFAALWLDFAVFFASVTTKGPHLTASASSRGAIAPETRRALQQSGHPRTLWSELPPSRHGTGEGQPLQQTPTQPHWGNKQPKAALRNFTILTWETTNKACTSQRTDQRPIPTGAESTTDTTRSKEER